MTGPRLRPGAPVPLFDRLVDADIRTPDRGRDTLPPLDRDGLVLSIAAEVSSLLNTRSPRTRAEMAERPRTTLDYGVPDLTAFQPFDSTAEAELEAELESAITAFEPRLLSPRVRVHRLTPELRAAFLREWSERAGRLPPNRALRSIGAWFTVLPDEHDRLSLLVELSGRIRLDGRVEPVSFPVVMRNATGDRHAAG